MNGGGHQTRAARTSHSLLLIFTSIKFHWISSLAGYSTICGQCTALSLTWIDIRTQSWNCCWTGLSWPQRPRCPAGAAGEVHLLLQRWRRAVVILFRAATHCSVDSVPLLLVLSFLNVVFFGLDLQSGWVIDLCWHNTLAVCVCLSVFVLSCPF